MTKARITIIHDGTGTDPAGLARDLERLDGVHVAQLDLEQTREWVLAFTGFQERQPTAQRIQDVASALTDGKAQYQVLAVDPAGLTVAQAFARAEHPAGGERVAELEAEVATLRGEREEFDSHRPKLAAERQALEEMLDQLRRDLAVAEARLVEATGLKDAMRQQRDNAVDALSDAQVMLTKLRSALRDRGMTSSWNDDHWVLSDPAGAVNIQVAGDNVNPEALRDALRDNLARVAETHEHGGPVVVARDDLSIAYFGLCNASWIGMAEIIPESEVDIAAAAERIRDALGLEPLTSGD